MATATFSQFDQEYVLICGVEPKVFGEVKDVFADCHPRVTYDGATIQMSRVVGRVPPERYRRFMQLLPDHYLRHAYDGSTLEMMTPRKPHQWLVAILRRIVQTTAYVLDVPIRSLGARTLVSPSGAEGIQPDSSFYIKHEPRVCGREAPDIEDPPPDLAVEVEVTKPVVSRLSVLRRFEVPEVWHWRREEIRFLRLAERGECEPAERSIAYPWVSPSDVSRFLDRRREVDENVVIRGFADWARDAYRQWQTRRQT